VCEFVGVLLVCYLMLLVLWLALCLFALIVRFVVEALSLALRWTFGADSQELGARFDRWVAETRKRQIARGAPATLRGSLWVLAWRLWKVYVHPIRSWRSEFVYPPNKDVRGASDHKP
jgi:hypothetical protein